MPSGSLLGRDPDRDELLDQPSIRCEDSQGSVARSREFHRELDDPEEHRVERQLGGEDRPCLDRPPISVPGVSVVHGARIAQPPSPAGGLSALDRGPAQRERSLVEWRPGEETAPERR